MSESVCFTKSQITQAVVVKKKKKSKLRFNFGPIMTIKLMPVFFFFLDFSYILPLWRPIISSKGTLNGAAHQTQRPPLNTSATPIREASESKHWHTPGYLGGSLASSATSRFTLPVSCLCWRSRSLYLSFRIPNYLLTWSQPKPPLVSVSVCRGGVLTEKQEDCQVKSAFLLKM